MDTNIYEIIFTDTAREELNNIYDYISKKLLSEKSANTLMNKIEKEILLIERNPYSCTEIQVKLQKERYRRLVIDNYIVLYKVMERHKQVVIYRVLYGRRDYLKIL